ncbi:hypothetical protein NDU88_004411 [Pleurodeles waltl]|uniref:Uncharacterized protein n=1 Tax=Pleurodeles waltl TaxID=8319 RepID=A0AAV7T8F6_PLEWA|nr:hypothetical protein NDU88_004411 [Pleurodeles waltl]
MYAVRTIFNSHHEPNGTHSLPHYIMVGAGCRTRFLLMGSSQARSFFPNDPAWVKVQEARKRRQAVVTQEARGVASGELTVRGSRYGGYVGAAPVVAINTVVMDLRDSSRLSGNPAHDASEWRLPRGVRGEKDGLPCCLGNRDAGTSLGNPDIRVPDRPKREDGLPEEENTDDEEYAEGTGREEEGEHTEDKEKKTNDDGSRNGNRVVPKKAADQRGTEENGDTRADRHAQEGRG